MSSPVVLYLCFTPNYYLAAIFPLFRVEKISHTYIPDKAAGPIVSILYMLKSLLLHIVEYFNSFSKLQYPTLAWLHKQLIPLRSRQVSNIKPEKCKSSAWALQVHEDSTQTAHDNALQRTWKHHFFGLQVPDLSHLNYLFLKVILIFQGSSITLLLHTLSVYGYNSGAHHLISIVSAWAEHASILALSSGLVSKSTEPPILTGSQDLLLWQGVIRIMHVSRKWYLSKEAKKAVCWDQKHYASEHRFLRNNFGRLLIPLRPSAHFP